MKPLPVLVILLAVSATVFAMSREPAPEEEVQKRMPIAAVSAPEITPWLLAAAKDLGHNRVRAYDNSVFIEVGDDTISFFKEGQALQMHVGFESKFRHAKSDRGAALKELEQKGESIFQHALSLQAKSASKEQFASAKADSAQGG